MMSSRCASSSTCSVVRPTLMTPSRMAMVAGQAPSSRMIASTSSAVDTFLGIGHSMCDDGGFQSYDGLACCAGCSHFVAIDDGQGGGFTAHGHGAFLFAIRYQAIAAQSPSALTGLALGECLRCRHPKRVCSVCPVRPVRSSGSGLRLPCRR